MSRANEIVDRARECLGMRWAHLGTGADGSIDCIGLITRASGGAIKLPTYSARTNTVELMRRALEHMDRITLLEAQAGDVVVMRYWRDGKLVPTHFGLLADHPLGGLSIIHAFNGGGAKVIEHRFDDDTRARTYAAFRIRA